MDQEAKTVRVDNYLLDRQLIPALRRIPGGKGTNPGHYHQKHKKQPSAPLHIAHLLVPRCSSLVARLDAINNLSILVLVACCSLFSLPDSPGPCQFLRIQPDRHRPVIHQLHLHMGAKDTGGNSHPVFLNGLGILQIEPFPFLRRGSLCKTRPPALPAVGIERKLGDHQGSPAHIQQGKIHLPRRVFKNPQINGFLRQTPGVGLGVALSGAHQNQESLSGFARLFSFHHHPGLCDPLYQHPHLLTYVLFTRLTRWIRCTPFTCLIWANKSFTSFKWVISKVKSIKAIPFLVATFAALTLKFRAATIFIISAKRFKRSVASIFTSNG